MEPSRASVGKRAPDFDLACTRGSPDTRGRVTLAGFQDRWLLLVFYPRDFSLVCPTELAALSARLDEFQSHSCDLVGISTDSLETHERWIQAPRNQGGLGGLRFPLASDPDGAVSRAYGVYLAPQHLAFRGMFFIDPNGVLQYAAVHNLSVGRRSEDILRVLAALESGGMCAEDWRPSSPTLDPTKALVPGSVLGHYRIDEEVGQGSFAAVYRARDLVLDRVVALKVFRPDSLATPDAVLAEARASAALNHPHVCTIFAVDDGEGVPLIAMEYVDGRPLSALLQNGRLPEPVAARVGRQIAQGMAAAHHLGIIHGDLKPANILLAADGTVKLTDFGLARRAERSPDSVETEDWSAPTAGAVSGTPNYMSPEQSRGDPLTPASDVFALGVILYEMLTGRSAFSGANVLQVLHEIRGVDPGRLAAAVPGPFAPVLRGAVAPQPRDRTLSMAAIADLLGRVEGATPVLLP